MPSYAYTPAGEGIPPIVPFEAVSWVRIQRSLRPIVLGSSTYSERWNDMPTVCYLVFQNSVAGNHGMTKYSEVA